MSNTENNGATGPLCPACQRNPQIDDGDPRCSSCVEAGAPVEAVVALNATTHQPSCSCDACDCECVEQLHCPVHVRLTLTEAQALRERAARLEAALHRILANVDAPVVVNYEARRALASRPPRRTTP